MTPDMLALDLALGFAIGLTLGLLGGGGSILTVPALVYLVGQPPHAAVTASLAIVGVNSAVGAVFHRRGGSLHWRVALLFGGAGMVTAYLAAGLSTQVAPALLMALFAVLMLAVGVLMLVSKGGGASARRSEPAGSGSLSGNHDPARGAETAQPSRQPGPKVWVSLAAGAGVGLLTGLLGVGGGFLIVPALVMLVGLPMVQAVGTSLAIIAANSFAGLLGHLGAPLDLWLTASFATAGIAGAFAGAKLTRRLPAQRLRQAFAIFIIVLGIFLMFDNLPRLLA